MVAALVAVPLAVEVHQDPGSIMKYPTTLFSKEEIASIESAIKEAEEHTCAEVVPVVARVSGRYHRAEDLFGFLLSLASLACTWSVIQGISTDSREWSDGPTIALGLPIVLTILIVTFLIGIALASRIPVLRLPLIAKREMEEEVTACARETFHNLKVRGTANATGILIYVSLYEHQVHVMGDDTISSKLAHGDFQSICDTILRGFKSNQPAQGLQDGIRACGKLLAQHFPIEPGDKNELIDTLHLID